jgi:dihydrofolate synthase / folylpolyglutamate synthase
MRKLSALLGMPQHRFASIHVVGTNGKSSVTRMTAALLEAHGVSTGACVSPHAARWSERVLVHGREIGADEFAAAVERAAQAAEAVNRGFEAERRERASLTLRDRSEDEVVVPEGEAVTQFELATAAAFVALAVARVKAAVVEAGLGGRLDATNTIPSKVTVLTSVGLDHTEWLGESEEEIAAEKLAVLRDHTTLVLGQVSPAIRELAERTAAERGAELIVAPEDPGPGIELRAAGSFQRRNFALACAAAEAFLGELNPERVRSVATEIEIPGRLEVLSGDPPAVLDAAHNPDGVQALAEALSGIVQDRPVVACLAVLREKDVAGMARALAPALERVVCTEIPPAAEAESAKGASKEGPAPDKMPRLRVSVPAGELADAWEEAGIPAEAEPDLATAVARARELAREAGGVLLVTGSHYALTPARRALGLCED